MPRFNVRRHTGGTFILTIDTLPGRTFGPYDFPDMVKELYVTALLSPSMARDTVMRAGATGSATTEGG